LGRGQERVFHPWLFTFDPFRIRKYGRPQQESTPCCLNPLRICSFCDAGVAVKNDLAPEWAREIQSFLGEDKSQKSNRSFSFPIILVVSDLKHRLGKRFLDTFDLKSIREIILVSLMC